MRNNSASNLAACFSSIKLETITTACITYLKAKYVNIVVLTFDCCVFCDLSCTWTLILCGFTYFYFYFVQLGRNNFYSM